MPLTLQETLLVAALKELERQGDEATEFAPYVDATDPSDTVLDGRFDLGALVAAIGRAALLDAATTVTDYRIRTELEFGKPKLRVATPPEIAARIRRDAADLDPNH